MDSPLVQLASPVTLNGPVATQSSSSRLRNGLLTALSLSPGVIVEFTSLQDALWGEENYSARSNLRTLKSLLDEQIRSTGLAAQLRLTTHRSRGGAGGGYRLQVPRDRVDVLLGQHHYVAAAAALPNAPETALAHCERARALDLERFGTDLPRTAWMAARQIWAANLGRSVRELLCIARLLVGQHTRGYLDACALHVPGEVRTRTWIGLIAGAYGAGDLDAALDHVRDCRGAYLDKGLHLPDEIGSLHRAILDNDDLGVRGLLCGLTC